ncbi:hypothetical protein PGT21_024688 [Puccinia graminis f. sp. tritici]|nr:hypothetical protein PGT21_024688 [Puccinia graminis f. sp. tritici]
MAVSYPNVRFRSLNSIRKKRAFASRWVGKKQGASSGIEPETSPNRLSLETPKGRIIRLDHKADDVVAKTSVSLHDRLDQHK